MSRACRSLSRKLGWNDETSCMKWSQVAQRSSVEFMLQLRHTHKCNRLSCNMDESVPRNVPKQEVNRTHVRSKMATVPLSRRFAFQIKQIWRLDPCWRRNHLSGGRAIFVVRTPSYFNRSTSITAVDISRARLAAVCYMSMTSAAYVLIEVYECERLLIHVNYYGDAPLHTGPSPEPPLTWEYSERWPFSISPSMRLRLRVQLVVHWKCVR